MATNLETRMTYFCRSGNNTAALSYTPSLNFYSDARGALTISYELNAAKTAYIVYIAHKAIYYSNSEHECYINATSISSKIKVNDGEWVSLGSYSKNITGTANFNTKYTHTYGTKSYEIPIQNDGTCKFSVQCSFTAKNIDYYDYDYYKQTGGSTKTFTYNDYELPKVNVLSSITNDSSSSNYIDFGSNVVFSITRPNDIVTHTLTYTIDGTEYVIGEGITTSKTYAFPTSLVNKYPNNENVSVLVTCASSNGTKCNTTVYLKVPSSYVPTISSITLTEKGTVPSSWGIWLKTKSKINVVISASGAGGSSILSYAATANKESFTSSTFTTSELRNSGTQTISVTVKDSRGRSATKTISISVIDYFVPSVASYEVIRCNSSGEEDNDGTYGKVKCSYLIASCSSKNSKKLIVKYGDQTKTYNLSSYSGEFIADDLFEDLAVTANHVFLFYICDNFYPNGLEYKFTMFPSFVLVSKLNGGKGITLGQIATKEGFNVWLDMEYKGQTMLEYEVISEWEE